VATFPRRAAGGLSLRPGRDERRPRVRHRPGGAARHRVRPTYAVPMIRRAVAML
jgi:hypothetical protein